MNCFSLLSRKSVLIRIAAFLTATVLLLSAAACGESTADDTSSKAAFTEVKVDELDNGLTDFLTRFTDWYYVDYGEKKVYDSKDAGNGETNIMRSILGNASCADWDKYPVSHPEEKYNAKKLDPKKWAKESGGSYMTYDSKDADWIAVNIFNATEKDIEAMRKQGEENKWFYLDGGKYYVLIGGVGDPMTEYKFESAMTDGKVYFVNFSSNFNNGEEVTFNGAFTAEVEQKTIDGRNYWTLNKFEQTSPDTAEAE